MKNRDELAIINTRNKIEKKEMSDVKGSHYFNFFYLEQKYPWFTNKGRTREVIVTINRIRANRYKFGVSLAKIGLVENS